MSVTIKHNWLDRLCAYLAPAQAVERAKARLALAGGYTGASRDRSAFRNWQAGNQDADGDLLPCLAMLRERSRDLVRNNPLAAGVVHTVCTNVVGTGLRLQVRLDRGLLGVSDEKADAWAAQTESEFALWAESPACDITGQCSFYDCQQLVFRSALENGDCFVLLPLLYRPQDPYALRLQVIEADRVSNPEGVQDSETLIGGVEKDTWGAPLAYHIREGHPRGLLRTQDFRWRRVPARTAAGRRAILPIYTVLRPGQTRGVPYLAPVIEAFKQLGLYTQAEAMAAVVSAKFTVFVKTPDGQGALLDAEKRSARFPGLQSGAIVNLSEGEDITTVNPGRPNAAFDPFVQAILRQIGVALELPYEVLIKHFTASYSAARAALLEAWKFYSSKRLFLANHFCQAVYEEWLYHAILEGRIAAPGFLTGDPLVRKAYSGAVWIGPAPGQIDPLKEIEAAQKRIDLGISSLSRECAALSGVDWETELHQQKKEARLRQAAGLVFSQNPAHTKSETE